MQGCEIKNFNLWYLDLYTELKLWIRDKKIEFLFKSSRQARLNHDY